MLKRKLLGSPYQAEFIILPWKLALVFSAVNAKPYKETFLFCESLDFKKNVRPGFYTIQKTMFSIFSSLLNKTKWKHFNTYKI